MIELLHELNNATWPAALVLSAAAIGAAWVVVAYIRER